MKGKQTEEATQSSSGKSTLTTREEQRGRYTQQTRLKPLRYLHVRGPFKQMKKY